MNFIERWNNEQCYYRIGFAFPDGKFLALREQTAGRFLSSQTPPPKAVA